MGVGALLYVLCRHLQSETESNSTMSDIPVFSVFSCLQENVLHYSLSTYDYAFGTNVSFETKINKVIFFIVSLNFIHAF